jgi:Ca2+-dependent lipid-binding protein
MSFNSIIKVDVKRATGLKDKDTFGKSDPYVLIKFEHHEACPNKAQTKVVRGTVNPNWDESFYFLVKDDCKSFQAEVYDQDPLKDDKLGHVTFAREHDLNKKEQLKGGALDLDHGKGKLEIYFKEFNILGGVGGIDQLQRENLQLLKVQIHRATNLKSQFMDRTDAYVRLAFTHLDEGHRVSGHHLRTKTVNNNKNPVWNQTLEVCIPANLPSFRVEVFDDDMARDDPIGYADIQLHESHVRDQRYHLTQGDIELSYEKIEMSSFFSKH